MKLLTIQDLINNPKKRKKMGEEGRELAKKEFDIKNIVQAHIEIYKNLYK